jgi:peptidyl-prolyl cis-trans isomerase D
MLRQLRSKKVAKKLLIGLAIIIIPAFVLWGAKSSSRKGGPTSAGTIFGAKISFDEYATNWRAVRNDAMMRYEDFHKIYKQLDLEQQAWDRLILLHEAKRQRIRVSNEEVIETIRGFSFLIRDNKFDNELYENIVTNTFRTTPREFEEDIRNSLIISKLVNAATEDLEITEEELLQKYKEENEKIKIAYVAQAAKDFSEEVKITDEEIENYYKNNSYEFKLPERTNIEYIEFKYTDYTDGIEVGEDETRYYYDTHIEEFEHPESIHARHILFENEEVAKEILKKLKKGGDFVELAKKHSTGPTKDAGGDLGYFERGKMVKEFEDAAFALETGGISEVVKSSFGYHIIKLEDRKGPYTEKFEDTKEKIKETLLRGNAKNKAYENTLLAGGAIDKGEALEKVAEKYKKTVKNTGYFSRYGMIPNIGWNPEIQKVSFELKLNEVKLISPNEAESDINYIIRLKEKKESEIPLLEEVKNKVENKVKQEKAVEAARESMKKHKDTISKKMESGSSFKNAAKSAGLEVKETDHITRRDYIKEIGPASAIKEIFDYKVGDVSSVLNTDRVSCIVEVADLKTVDKEKFEEEKADFRNRLIQQKKSQSINQWLTDLKQKANLKSNL